MTQIYSNTDVFMLKNHIDAYNKKSLNVGRKKYRFKRILKRRTPDAAEELRLHCQPAVRWTPDGRLCSSGWARASVTWIVATSLSCATGDDPRSSFLFGRPALVAISTCAHPVRDR